MYALLILRIQLHVGSDQAMVVCRLQLWSL